MYKIKMFALWIWVKLSDPFSDENEMVEVNRFTLYLFGYVSATVGWAFWFISPTLGVLDVIGRAIPIIGLFIVIPHFIKIVYRFIRSQYADYESFTISGGKQKPKNDD